MKRFNGIDTIRGISMWLMVAGHLIDWWIRSDLYWHKIQLYAILEPICSTGFLFASGISAALSYKASMTRIDQINPLQLSRVRNEYIFRALFILLIGFIYNIFVALIYGHPKNVWGWYVLQTIGFSLLLAWPLLKTPMLFRGALGFLLLSLNPLIYTSLNFFEGQTNLFGVLYFILYNPVDQYTIISFFSIFLIGTVLGDILFKLNIIKNKDNQKIYLRKNYIIPSLISGSLLILFGILFRFPEFIIMRTYSSFLYSLGIIITLLAILIAIQEFNLIKTKKSYKFLFYYSYYSFTVYLGHNILYFLFRRELTIFTVWLALIITTVLVGIFLNFAYKRFKRKISVKAWIGTFSYILAKKIADKTENRSQIRPITVTKS
ncbi:MAG: heparan-alpha-glucosaminide N-acetyltransferase domain-containing protein [Promethearchaeota archaeon]